MFILVCTSLVVRLILDEDSQRSSRFCFIVLLLFFFPYITVLFSWCGTPALRTMFWKDLCIFSVHLKKSLRIYHYVCSYSAWDDSSPQFTSGGKSLWRHIFHLEWCFVFRNISICPLGCLNLFESHFDAFIYWPRWKKVGFCLDNLFWKILMIWG